VVDSFLRYPIALAILSAVFHAGWNALAKSVHSARAATLLTLTFALPVAAATACLGGGFALPPKEIWGYLAMSGGGEVFYVITLGIALERGELGLTYGVSRATAMMLVWPFAMVFFGVSISLAGVIASLLVLFGIALCRPVKPSASLSTVASTPVATAEPVALSVAQRSIAPKSPMALSWTLLSGLGVAIYHTGYKGSVTHHFPPTTTFLWTLMVAVPCLWLLLGKSQLGEVKRLLGKHAFRMMLSGTGAASSFLLALFALTTKHSGVVLGVRNSSVGFALLFALLLGERPTKRQYLGLALFMASVPFFAKS
jgi:uncharacterized membrane protein